MKRFAVYYKGQYVNARTTAYNAERYINKIINGRPWERFHYDFIVWTTDKNGDPLKLRVDENIKLIDYSWVE